MLIVCFTRFRPADTDCWQYGDHVVLANRTRFDACIALQPQRLRAYVIYARPGGEVEPEVSEMRETIAALTDFGWLMQ